MKQVKLVWWFVWGALTMSALMYLVLLQTGESEADPDYSDAGLRSILMMVSLVSVMISFAVHFFITKRMVAMREGAAVMKALTPFIVSLALAESVAIYGFVLGLGERISPITSLFVSVLKSTPRNTGHPKNLDQGLLQAICCSSSQL